MHTMWSVREEGLERKGRDGKVRKEGEGWEGLERKGRDGKG